MKTQIENLIQLAQEFVEFAMSVKQNDAFSEYGKTRVYFANNRRTQAVDFDSEAINVSLYLDKIEIPFNVTEKYLQTVYESAKLELSEFKANKSEVILLENGNKKRADIEACQKRLKELQES